MIPILMSSIMSGLYLFILQGLHSTILSRLPEDISPQVLSEFLVNSTMLIVEKIYKVGWILFLLDSKRLNWAAAER